MEVLTWPFGDLFKSKDDDSSGPPLPAKVDDTGKVTADSVETQAAQRRLARLSKYFTSPTGVLNDPSTGTTGVFS